MLDVRNVSFSRGGREILDRVSFTVRSGERIALVGANGAGKTTLLRLLAGLLAPTEGTVRADEFDALREPVRFRHFLGYMGERAPVDDDMRVADYLRFRARLRGEGSKKIRHRVAEALEQCGLEDLAAARIDRLSFGQRKRVALADAMLLRPRFLLLDDVFAGLDASVRASLGRTLSSFSGFASVLMTGHEIDELGAVASRFLVLRNGTVTAAADAAEARKAML